ncbi:NAD(P)H-hydrate dehydratase [Deferrisoma sp.]
MLELLTAEEMKALDAWTIQEVGVPGPVLMETAGRGVVRALLDRFAAEAGRGPVVVVCGRGNNGGDGFVVARCLKNYGLDAVAVLLGSRDRVGGDAAVHLGAFLGSGGCLVEVTEGCEAEAAARVRGAALVVDAVLGTGLRAEVQGLAARAIGWMNEAPAPVVSVDIPSGVDSDTGAVRGAAVRADLTVTFAWPKRGHFLFPGAGLRGELAVVDIGIPRSGVGRVGPEVALIDPEDLAGLVCRPPDAHKGTLGHVWVVGGSRGKTGAPGLAAVGALRAGAGLATVASPGGLGIEARLPLEVMTHPVDEGPDWPAGAWETLAGEPADAWVVGPGLGTGENAGRLVGALLERAESPCVVDADALNLLAAAGTPRLGPDRVLTPHPGEAARLLGRSTAEVQADRVGAAKALVERTGAVVVLKGAGTLVAAPGERVWLVAAGNPGMATAGTGDVLAGVIGALLARGLAPSDAARLGAWVHAAAGDAAAAAGVEGRMAGDLLARLPEAMARIGSAAAPAPGRDRWFPPAGVPGVRRQKTEDRGQGGLTSVL